MDYAIDRFALALKQARERKGLSQRALSKRTGIPQGQISRIENGAVDLRLSSLIELARALDLEPALVPRKSLAAVNTIIRAGGSRSEKASAGAKDLRRFINAVNELVHEHPQTTEYVQMIGYLRDLQHFALSEAELGDLRNRYKALRSALDDKQDAVPVREALGFLRQLRNRLAHAPAPTDAETVKPAYSLDESSDG